MKLSMWEYHVRLIALAAVLVAVAGVVFAPDPIHAQGGDNDYVDVGLTLEVPYDKGGYEHDLNIVVVNNGSRTAYDVEVVLEIKYPEDTYYYYTSEVPVGSVSVASDGRSLRWSIPALGGLQRVMVSLFANHTNVVPPVFDNAIIPHEHFGRVTTSSFEGDLHKGNNTSRV